MKASFDKDQRAWTLHHINTHHNHGPIEALMVNTTSITSNNVSQAWYWMFDHRICLTTTQFLVHTSPHSLYFIP